MGKEIVVEKFDAKFFDFALVDRYYTFYFEKKNVRSPEAKALKEELIALYQSKDAELKKEIEKNLADRKAAKEAEIKNCDLEKATSLEKAKADFENAHQNAPATKAELKAYSDIKVGIETVCKRSKIKAVNTYNEDIKNEKMKRYMLHSEFVNLKYFVSGSVTGGDSLRSKVLEDRANLNLGYVLKDKKTYVGLVPLAMLLLIIVAYFIGKSYTNYGGDLGTVINKGIFVAVVATGAVYIYSQGGFDMSLGNAALMCATIAALLYNSTGNMLLSLGVAIVLGAALGVVNAIFATMLNLPVMVMTLTMMNILSAIHEAILDEHGGLISVESGMIKDAWIYAIFLAVFFVICWFIFNYTKVGRRNKFIGSNKIAAKFNGINLMRAGIISFAISGVGLGICGFLFACAQSGSKYGAATVLGQVGLDVVIAIVFGGMTTSGGPKSKVSCAIIGAFFAVFLDEFFAAISTPAFAVGDFCYMAKGIIFIVISLANMWDTRGKMLASGGSIQ